MKKKIIALDVAFTNIGWAIITPYTDGFTVDAIGSIKNPSDPKKKKRNIRKSDIQTERVQKVYQELKDVILEHKPSGVIAEIPGGNAKSTTSAKAMEAANTIVAITVHEQMLPAEWTTEADGKLALCRKRSASKLDMQRAAMKLIPELEGMVPKSKSPKSKSGYESWFEHVADAIAAFISARYGTLAKMIAQSNGSALTGP